MQGPWYYKRASSMLHKGPSNTDLKQASQCLLMMLFPSPLPAGPLLDNG